jgi:hypothetical protein
VTGENDEGLDIPGNISGMVEDSLNSLEEETDELPEGETEHEEPEEDEGTTAERKTKKFEIKSEYLLDDIQRIYSEKGWLPKADDIREQGNYSFSKYKKEFGSIDEALEAAGINKKDELLNELERVRDELGEMPSQRQMREHGRCSASMYSDYFDSWTKAKNKVSERKKDLSSGSTDEVKKKLSNTDDPEVNSRREETGDTVECPVTGCTYTGDVKSVAGHVSGKRDSTHDWGVLGYEGARQYKKEKGTGVRGVEGRAAGSKGLKQGSEDGSRKSNKEEILIGELEKASEKIGSTLETPDRAEKRETLLNELQKVSEKLDSKLKTPDTAEKREILIDELRKASERINSKLKTDDSNFKHPTKELADELQQLYSDIGRLPKEQEIREKTEYSVSEYTNSFESLDKAFEAAGIDKEEELLNEIERVGKIVSKKPAKSDMKEHAKYSPSMYYDYFSTWKEAKGQVDMDFEYIEELLDDLQRIYSEKGRPPRADDIQEKSDYSIQDYEKVFESLDEALEAASINMEEDLLYKHSTRSKTATGSRSESDQETSSSGRKPEIKKKEELLRELKLVWEEQGEPPSWRMNSSVDRYREHFGSWSNAKDVLREADMDVSVDMEKVPNGEIEQDDSEKTSYVNKIAKYTIVILKLFIIVPFTLLTLAYIAVVAIISIWKDE